MAEVLQILSQNYSGETVDITFIPLLGEIVKFTEVTLPYNFINDNFNGDYILFFPKYNLTHRFSIPTPIPQQPKCRCTQFVCSSFVGKPCKISYLTCKGQKRKVTLISGQSFKDCVSIKSYDDRIENVSIYLFNYCDETSDCITLTPAESNTPTPTITPTNTVTPSLTPSNTPSISLTPSNSVNCKCYEFTNNTPGTTAYITANDCSGIGINQLVLTNPIKPTGKICVPGDNFSIQQQNQGDVTWTIENKCGFLTKEDAIAKNYTCAPECSVNVVKGSPPSVRPIGANTEINFFISRVNNLSWNLIPVVSDLVSPGGLLYSCLISLYNNDSSLFSQRIRVFDFGYPDMVRKLATEKNYEREIDNDVNNVINIILNTGDVMVNYYQGTLSNFVTPTQFLIEDSNHLRQVLNSVNYSIGGFIVALNTGELSAGGDSEYDLLMYFLSLLFTSTSDNPPPAGVPSLPPPVGLNDFYISNFTYVGTIQIPTDNPFWPQYLFATITSTLNSIGTNPNC